jgi:hypothetical protein
MSFTPDDRQSVYRNEMYNYVNLYNLDFKHCKIMDDYIPRKDAEIVSWSANFSAQVATNAAVWEIPYNEVTDLQNATALFATLQAQAGSPAKTSIIVAQKDAARKNLVGIIRAMAGFRLKNPIITDAQRRALGLRVRDAKPSSIKPPHTRPELDIDVVDVRRLAVNFRDMGSKSKARPYGVNGALIKHATLDTPPADHDALTRTVLATRTPHILEFTEEERGETVYVVICWQNEKGELGPWSEIESAIVP